MTAGLWGIAIFSNSPRVLSGHTGGINLVALVPDGRWALTGWGDTTARLWELISQMSLATEVQKIIGVQEETTRYNDTS